MNHKDFALQAHLHSERNPHWSEGVDWRPGRWDPMSNAPCRGYPIMEVRGREADGTIVEPMHYACGDGDGMMLPFDGWFIPNRGGSGFIECRPVEWQPLRALPEPI
jgi:hypothetical protein